MADYRYTATVDRVIDGDTIVVTADLGFRLYHTTPVRLARINAPELNTPEGKTVRAVLDNLLTGKQVTIQTYKSGRDKYGRWLADVWAGDLHVNEAMVESGHASSTK